MLSFDTVSVGDLVQYDAPRNGNIYKVTNKNGYGLRLESYKQTNNSVKPRDFWRIEYSSTTMFTPFKEEFAENPFATKRKIIDYKPYLHNLIVAIESLEGIEDALKSAKEAITDG